MSDFNLLFRVASLESALALSAVDPVVVPTNLAGILAYQFYDCTDPEEVGLRVMATRIKHDSDIRQHLRIHEGALSNLQSMQEFANVHNRKGYSEAGLSLCQDVGDYVRLTEEHRKRLGRDAFLNYPHTMPGHIFMIDDSDLTRELVFNPGAYCDDALGTIGYIQDLLREFKVGTGKIPKVISPASQDTGEGISDTSLRGRIELNKELLRRVEFQI